MIPTALAWDWDGWDWRYWVAASLLALAEDKGMSAFTRKLRSALGLKYTIPGLQFSSFSRGIAITLPKEAAQLGHPRKSKSN